MLPFLFPHSPLETPTYFVLYLLAFLGAILFLIYRAKSFGLPEVRAVDLGFVLFLSGVLGARILHIFVEAPHYYMENPWRFFYFWQGGFVFYGGLLLGTLSMVAFLRWIKEPVGKWADALSPALMLGLGIGRMGCLAAGCCYGKPTEWAWNMVFTNPRAAAPLHISLHPTQLLEALYCFGAACILYRFVKKPLKPEGFVMALTFLSYGVFRFFLEFLRGDNERGLFFEGRISSSQILSVIFVILSLSWIIWKKVRAHSSK